MPEVKRGAFTLDLGIFKLQAEVSEDDRQCAWELYTEIVTRVAVVGKAHDPDCTDFSGEILAESLISLHDFFVQLRGIMRKFPVGRLNQDHSQHLGVLINDLIVNTLRPFLETWQADYRFWWEQTSKEYKPTMERQRNYPRYDEFINEWRNLRLIMRDLQRELVVAYRLVNVHDKQRLHT